MKLIDRLEKSLEAANIQFERDGWIERMGYKKPTKEGWIDIEIPTGKMSSITVHFFFKNGENVLSQIELFENKKAIVNLETKKISTKKVKNEKSKNIGNSSCFFHGA